MKKNRCLITMLIVFIILAFSGCKSKPPEKVIKPPPIPETKRLPIDYLFMIDNSGSIRGEDRSFAREAVKLFVELAEKGDKVAIIAFDDNARLLANQVIHTHQDREDIKNNAESGLTFRGQFTDISQPFLYTASNQNEIFRGQGYSPAVILITDGKLEPRRPRTARAAYDDIMASLREKLSGLPFYSIGLGDTDIHHRFLNEINGLIFLRDQIANSTGGRFFHAGSVDQLINIYLKILKITKGISEMAGRFVFRVDESTEKISAIVMKRTTSERICTTLDIVIKDPDNHSIDFPAHKGYYEVKDIASRIRWHSSSPYYDLIVIEKPFPGDWKIALKDGRKPQVVSVVKTLINLKYKVEKNYWLNERKIAIAWLYDERKDAVSTAPYQLAAKFDRAEDFVGSHHSIPFQRTEGGIYVASLSEEKGFSLSPGRYFIEITAKNDPAFFRRLSEPIPLNMREPYFTFSSAESTITRKPGWKGVSFLVELDTKAKNYPSFERDANISLYLERIDKEGKRHAQPLTILDRELRGDRLAYAASLHELETGAYHGHYLIKVRLTTGEQVKIRSEDFFFELRTWIWRYVIAASGILFVLSFILWIIGWKTERFNPGLEGMLNVISPGDIKTRKVNLKKNRSARALKWGRGGECLEFKPGQPPFSELQRISFRVEAGRKGKYKRVKLKVLSGPIKINNQKVNISDIYHRDEIVFKDGARDFKIRFDAPGIRKTKKGRRR